MIILDEEALLLLMALTTLLLSSSPDGEFFSGIGEAELMNISLDVDDVENIFVSTP